MHWKPLYMSVFATGKKTLIGHVRQLDNDEWEWESRFRGKTYEHGICQNESEAETCTCSSFCAAELEARTPSYFDRADVQTDRYGNPLFV